MEIRLKVAGESSEDELILSTDGLNNLNYIQLGVLEHGQNTVSETVDLLVPLDELSAALDAFNSARERQAATGTLSS